jgi:transposase
VTGKTWWEWVFVGTLAVLHIIRPSRGKVVVQELFGAIQPMVWVSDMLGSQRGHGMDWQVCLAHLLRDARYAVECGDTAFSAAFKRLLLRAIAIGQRRDTLKDTTLKHYRADLDRRLDRIMAAVPIGEPGRKLRKRIAANRAHLFVFVTDRRVPFTNNVSERSLRPSVIFRKVTNGFRCEWGAETYAEVAPVSWTPDGLRSRSPRWPRQDCPTHLSSAARWWTWCMPAARRRSWRRSLNRRRSRSGTGLRSLRAMRGVAMVA